MDADGLRDAVCLPNGIILVPHQVIDRLANDSQVAAVLASRMVCVLERQQLWKTPEPLKSPALQTAAELLLPQVAGPVLAGVQIEEAIRLHYLLEQSDRVALSLLHDAGYDINEAPVAWWLLASGKTKPAHEIFMPPRSKYLYEILGKNWNN